MEERVFRVVTGLVMFQGITAGEVFWNVSLKFFEFIIVLMNIFQLLNQTVNSFQEKTQI